MRVFKQMFAEHCDAKEEIDCHRLHQILKLSKIKERKC